MPVPAAGDVPFTAIPAVPTNIYFPVNGMFQPEIPIRPGETQRWRILAAGPHRFFLLELDGHSFWQIAQDGIPFREARPVKEILLSPGNRVEVIVKGGAPGRYRLRALAFDQGHPGGPRPERLLATMVSSGEPMDGKLPGRLVTPPPPLPDTNIASERTLVFSGEIATAPVAFFIDGREFDQKRTDVTVTAGTTEEWTIQNQDVFQHPFHIHVNPFQVVEINGIKIHDPAWWDTFPLPPRGEIKIRQRFRPDVTGKTVYHCHILPHEDNGMMGIVDIQPASTTAGKGGNR